MGVISLFTISSFYCTYAICDDSLFSLRISLLSALIIYISIPNTQMLVNRNIVIIIDKQQHRNTHSKKKRTIFNRSIISFNWNNIFAGNLIFVAHYRYLCLIPFPLPKQKNQ